MNLHKKINNWGTIITIRKNKQTKGKIPILKKRKSKDVQEMLGLVKIRGDCVALLYVCGSRMLLILVTESYTLSRLIIVKKTVPPPHTHMNTCAL